MSMSLHRFRRTAVIFAILLAGSLILATAPAAILADRDEENRIDQFQPITITEDTFLDLEALAEDIDPVTLLLIYMELQDFATFDTNLSEDSFQKVDDLNDVAQHLGGAFATPDETSVDLDDGTSYYAITEAGYAEVTFDVEKARRISRLLEISPDWLPESSEHSELTIRVDLAPGGAHGWESGNQKLTYGQMAIPEIDIPDAIDLDKFIDIILDDPRLPDDVAEQLRAIEDWERTIPVPMPEEVEHQELEINGGAGLLVTIDEGSAVIWEVNGTIHFVAGTFDADELEEIARSVN